MAFLKAVTSPSATLNVADCADQRAQITNNEAARHFRDVVAMEPWMSPFIGFCLSQGKPDVRSRALSKATEMPTGDQISGRRQRAASSRRNYLISPRTFKQRLPPRFVVGVPLDRFRQASLEIVARFPFQLPLAE